MRLAGADVNKEMNGALVVAIDQANDVRTFDAIMMIVGASPKSSNSRIME